ncbi:MAG TPA: gliding motility lipoprotein GldD [Bacteroidales bacterium]|nr:gliding motility lipoprotein GldD [Bacteroidales bacterium]HRR15415.1 gliding motility lipoprotein GldD [Bacteroidales bacterium]HRT46980.1 gliding motility lipoprotein GldD [Bacteroidales bacterium]HRU56110.1 gliding motility lipoprotein GldD [Bacteroidales bacterium]
MKRRKIEIIILAALLSLFISCREKTIPRPRGYFRIDFPEKQYILYDTSCPFIFEYPAYGKISYDLSDKAEPCWFNLYFPSFRATLHISYKKLKGNLPLIVKEANDFVYSHTIKADAISEQPWYNREERVYGILYDIKGNAASAIQFVLTDSLNHFLRGALYFSSIPNEDSLAPVIDFFRKDIVHFIESFRWKN